MCRINSELWSSTIIVVVVVVVVVVIIYIIAMVVVMRLNTKTFDNFFRSKTLATFWKFRIQFHLSNVFFCTYASCFKNVSHIFFVNLTFARRCQNCSQWASFMRGCSRCCASFSTRAAAATTSTTEQKLPSECEMESKADELRKHE